MLTKKQRDLLIFIHESMSQGNIAPSFEEMKEALGLKSKSGIHRLITGLVERGYLERLPHRARALEVKKLPDNMKFSNQDTQAQTSLPNYLAPAHANDQFCDIPVFGKIAAGSPIEAIRNEGEHISVPNTMLGQGEHYALQVEGDSMIEAGIHDQDTVIISKCSNAENGTIIVALVDDEEVTLKRLEKTQNTIILHPENSQYTAQILEPDRVKIQGKLVSLLRSYH